MPTPSRPKRVVIVDADNPLVEVRGDFFWREDHEQILAAARESAHGTGYESGYRSGYQAGWSAAAQQTGQRGEPQQFVFRRRLSPFGRLRRGLVWAVVLIVVLAYVATLMQHALNTR